MEGPRAASCHSRSALCFSPQGNEDLDPHQLHAHSPRGMSYSSGASSGLIRGTLLQGKPEVHSGH
jgi:hypothetical protein